MMVEGGNIGFGINGNTRCFLGRKQKKKKRKKKKILPCYAGRLTRSSSRLDFFIFVAASGPTVLSA